MLPSSASYLFVHVGQPLHKLLLSIAGGKERLERRTERKEVDSRGHNENIYLTGRCRNVKYSRTSDVVIYGFGANTKCQGDRDIP